MLVPPNTPFILIANIRRKTHAVKPRCARSPAVRRRIQSDVGQFFLNSAERGTRQKSEEVNSDNDEQMV